MHETPHKKKAKAIPAIKRAKAKEQKYDELFGHVHALLKQGRLSIALRALMDDTGCLRRKFRLDANHAHYLIGDIFFRNRNFQRAKSAFRNALRSWPDDVQAMHALGNCYSELGRPRMTERVLGKAVATLEIAKPKNQGDLYCKIVFNLGNALFDQGKYEEAIQLFGRLAGSNNPVKQLALKNLLIARAVIKREK